MNKTLLAIVVVVGGVAPAPSAWAATCDDIALDPALLAEYPNVRRTCRGVVDYNGHDYMKQEARVMSVHRDGLIGLRFRHADGSMGKTIELQAPADFTVTIDGTPRKLTALSRGDSIEILLRGQDANYYAIDERTAEPIEASPAAATFDPEPESEEQLAQAGSIAPLWGFLGVALTLAGMALTFVRCATHLPRVPRRSSPRRVPRALR